MMRLAWFLAALMGFAATTAVIADTSTPQTESRAQAAMMLPVDPDPLIVETDEGERRFSIEVADTAENRARGLMFREDMDDDRGMLFVFEQSSPVGFWMKNTPMALDLVFIDEDGVIAAVLPGEPFSTSTISPGVPVRFVLELKQGTAQEAGIGEGDRMRHPRIDAAQAR